MATAGEAIEYKCLIHATNGKKTISTSKKVALQNFRDQLPALQQLLYRLVGCQALGDRKGINRFGDFSAPLDEALIHTSLDLSGRPHLSYNLDIPTQRVGTYDAQLKLNTDFASIGCPETASCGGIMSDSVGEKFEEKIIVVQDFGGGKKTSVMEKLVDIVYFLHLEIHEAFGNAGASQELQIIDYEHLVVWNISLGFHFANCGGYKPP
ncbi:hypothetical protein Ahy_B08g093039 [Arachis hypogaea]|uniref:Uncharacterized protein n=1 Tax=Arachis hypogaea TaxID=3818 RepID=A0A444Y511_ARAHY|nr:hypothetical protein Ahy_B08g093039 [Arachis hypogaea]